MKNKIVHFVFALMLMLSALGISASTALADQPIMEEGVYDFSTTMTGVCSFDVQVDATMKYTDTFFFDQDGLLTRIVSHMVEQDTFSANGKTLVGIPYTFNNEVIIDSLGNLLHAYSTGIVAKVRLPDGSLFITAGWFDWVTRSPGFALTPDRGNMGNIAGFCAALAP